MHGPRPWHVNCETLEPMSLEMWQGISIRQQIRIKDDYLKQPCEQVNELACFGKPVVSFKAADSIK
jgi:hypothetical protein